MDDVRLKYKFCNMFFEHLWLTIYCLLIKYIYPEDYLFILKPAF